MSTRHREGYDDGGTRRKKWVVLNVVAKLHNYSATLNDDDADDDEDDDADDNDDSDDNDNNYNNFNDNDDYADDANDDKDDADDATSGDTNGRFQLF